MNRFVRPAVLGALALAAAAPAFAISPRDADAAQAACTAAARERRIDVRGVRDIRNDGARRIAVELETGHRTIVLCRWDRRGGRVEFPNHEGFTPRPAPVAPVAPVPLPRPQARPQARPQPVPAAPPDPGTREAAVQICRDLAATRATMDAPPPRVVDVQRVSRSAIDVLLQDGAMTLRCRYDLDTRTAHWQ